MEGVFFVHGVEAGERGHGQYYLVLQGGDATYSYRLGMSRKTAAIRKHVRRGDFSSYDFAYFATSGYNGVDLQRAAAGVYEVCISLSTGGSLFSASAGSITLE